MARRHDGLAVESEDAQRSRDRLTVASGVGACRRANEAPVPVRRASAPHLNHAVETTGLYTGDVRRGARGAGRMQSRYDNRSAHRTMDLSGASARRGGAVRIPESLPGWRALGAVAVRSRG